MSTQINLQNAMVLERAMDFCNIGRVASMFKITCIKLWNKSASLTQFFGQNYFEDAFPERS